jgi:hypothetical protein
MFRKLTDVEHAAVRCYLADPELTGYMVHGLKKLMQNYQDTATELAEHEAALDARLKRCPVTGYEL